MFLGIFKKYIIKNKLKKAKGKERLYLKETYKAHNVFKDCKNCQERFCLKWAQKATAQNQ